MELPCPIQRTYRPTEVTVSKDLAQHSMQKTLKGPLGHFQLNGDLSMLHLSCSVQFSAQQMQLSNLLEKGLILMQSVHK